MEDRAKAVADYRKKVKEHRETEAQYVLFRYF